MSLASSVRLLSRIVSWPAALLHELTHLLIALPWAEQAAVVFDAEGAAACRIDWGGAEPPRWALILAAYGPLIVGSLIGVAGAWALIQQQPAREHWPLLAILAVWWTTYTLPSADDRARVD